jgi:hypothetical protein
MVLARESGVLDMFAIDPFRVKTQGAGSRIMAQSSHGMMARGRGAVRLHIRMAASHPAPAQSIWEGGRVKGD